MNTNERDQFSYYANALFHVNAPKGSDETFEAITYELAQTIAYAIQKAERKMRRHGMKVWSEHAQGPLVTDKLCRIDQ